MSTRRRRNTTIRTIPFPDYAHPIWKMGAIHVEIAFNVCNAFLELRGGRP